MQIHRMSVRSAEIETTHNAALEALEQAAHNEGRGVVQRAPCLHVRAAFRLGVSCRFIVLQLWLGHVRLAAAPRRRTHEHGAFERRPPAEARCAAAAASSSLVWSCPFLVCVCAVVVERQ